MQCLFKGINSKLKHKFISSKMPALMQRSSQGFTMIELIMVIVILGILAAFALPKFANLNSDAIIALLENMKGTLKSTAAIQHSIALTSKNGLQNAFINDGIYFDQGYPFAGSHSDGDSIPEIIEAIDIEINEWTFLVNINGLSPDGDVVRQLYITHPQIYSGGTIADLIATDCYVTYQTHVWVYKPPIIEVVTSSC